MAPTIEGSSRGNGRRIAIVVSRFNDFVTSRLRDGALECLIEQGVSRDDIDEVRVPGAFEIPLAARAAAATGRYHAVICLGAVTRGETPHFEYVAGACAAGVERVAADTGVPVMFGVLTTDNPEDAMARAGGARGNKGRDAALAALEMISVVAALHDVAAR